MECEKNPFLEMTQDQIKKLDEVLQSDQAKALLEEAAKKLMESTKPLRMDDSTIISSMESIGSLGDLDVLDIHTSTRSGIFADCDEDSDSMTTDMFCGNFSLEELIFLEHNYAMKSAPPVQNTCEIATQAVDENTKASSVPQSANRSPIRRSLRQIAKVERKQVAKNNAESEDLEDSDEDVVGRMSLESESESQNIEDNQQSNKSIATKTLLVRNKQKVDLDEINTGADSKLKSAKESQENHASNTNIVNPRGRKPKQLTLLSPDRLEPNKKSVLNKDDSSSPTKLSKRNLSPRKRVSIDVNSVAEKQSPNQKAKNFAVQNDKNVQESTPKSARKRSTSESSDKSRGNKSQLKSPDGPRAKRKKSLLSADSAEAQGSSKKDGTAEDCKTSMGEPNAKESPVPSTPPVQKAKPIKKIKRESVTLGFEPALFSQPDVMVKIKSDESPNKKTDSVCEDTPKAIELDHLLSVKNNFGEDGLAVVKDVEPNDDMCIDEEPSKDGTNDIPDSSNIMLDDTTLPVLKDEDLSNLNQLELDSDKNVMLASSMEVKPQTVLMDQLNSKNPQQTNSKTVPVSSLSKNTEPSFKKEAKSFPGNKISQISSQGPIDDEIKKENSKPAALQGESISDIKKEIESTKEIVPTPERKSRRIIKKKEFFEEISFQETKRSAKHANQTPPSKKPSSDPAKKGVSDQTKRLSIEQPKKVLSEQSTKTLSEQVKKSSGDVSAMEFNESEEEEEEDSDWSSEDDPEKLWCICRKPHNHRFMIQCDSCEDWFHGSCVGVSRQQGQQLEKLKKEWKCPNCIKVEPAANISDKSHIKSLSNKDKFLKKPLRKESQEVKKTLKQFPSSNRDGVPKRVQKSVPVPQKQLSTEIGTKRKNGEIISVTNTKLQTKQVVRSKEPVNRNVTPIVKKSRTDIVQNQKGVAVTKSVPQIKTIIPQITTPSSSNGPVKKTPPAKEAAQKTVALSNVKKGTTVPKEKVSKDNKKKNGCVSCDKTATPGSCYCSHACIEKHANDCLKLIRESKNTKAVDAASQRLVVFDRHKGTVIAGDNSPTASEIIPWLKSNPNFMIACTSSDNHGKTDSSEDRNDSSSMDRRDDDDAAKETVRINVRKTLKNILEERCKNADDIDMVEEEIRKIALHIEEELHSLFRDNSFKYRAKYRSLMFNIKDPRNQGLFRKILTGKIPPDRLVKMSTEELASIQLAKWREQENQHCLDMIKRVQLEQLKTGGGLLIKKTHKGEVEIEGDGMSVIEQDIPKPSVKLDDEVPEPEKIDLTDLAKDTTHLHRSHLFDLNCKVCTGKIAPPPAEEVTTKKVRVAHSISVEFSSPTTVDPLEKSVSRVVDGKSPLSSTGDDSLDQSASTRPQKNPVTKKVTIDKVTKTKKKSSKGHSSVWKGFVFMQDVAKFVTNAYKVSGHTDRLNQDIPDSIQVCGRIKPDQVWDYLSKIKQSGNKELVIIRFQAANGEESATYNSFYHYLNSRKRYGVVNNSSKKIKDFYILPLPSTSPVPIVLMPFEGPGLPSQRPHLLLGVIVRHKIKQTSASTKKQSAKETSEVTDSIEGSFTPPLESRSYTPPLPNIPSIESEKSSSSLNLQSPASDSKITTSDESSIDHSIYVPGIPGITGSKRKAETAGLYERSYTPPLPGSGDGGKDDDKPYDPEQDISRLIMSEGKSDLSNGSHSKITSSSPVNLEKHKKLLDEITREFEETDRQLAALQQSINIPGISGTDIQPPFSQISGAKQVVDTGMPSFLELPQNLQEILNVVKQKTIEQDAVVQQQGAGDVDMRCLNNLPSVSSNFISMGKEDVDIRPKYNMSSSDLEDFNSSQGATPPPGDDEDDRCSTPRPSDPRIKLRTTYQEGGGEEVAPVPLSSMSASELVERAQKELAEMEAAEKAQQFSQSVPSASQASSGFPPSEWTHFKEPPPPGIEPSDVQSTPTIFSSKLQDSSTLQRHPLPPTYASTSVAQDSQHGTSFPPAIIPAPFQAHIPPPGFTMHPPPPTDFKTCPPPTVVSSGYLPPALQPGSLLKKDLGAEETWSTWQVPGHTVKGDWKEPPPPHWNEEDWNHRSEHYPADYYPGESESTYYSSEHTSDYYDKPDFHAQGGWDRASSQREDWYKRFPRGNRRDNWKGKKRFSSRGRGNRN